MSFLQFGVVVCLVFCCSVRCYSIRCHTSLQMKLPFPSIETQSYHNRCMTASSKENLRFFNRILVWMQMSWLRGLRKQRKPAPYTSLSKPFCSFARLIRFFSCKNLVYFLLESSYFVQLYRCQCQAVLTWNANCFCWCTSLVVTQCCRLALKPLLVLIWDFGDVQVLGLFQ